MFNTVLIANRGAIACRIIRTLKKLGIKSIALYSQADKESLHVREADEAYSLGEGGASETYLNQQKIIDIATQAGAQAIHPGYGFLSENADFSENFQGYCLKARDHIFFYSSYFCTYLSPCKMKLSKSIE